MQDVLDAIDANLAVVDVKGKILIVNRAWTDFATANGAPDFLATGVGTNYLEVTERAVGQDADEAQAAARGIRDVLSGARSHFSLEYPCHSPSESRWFLMKVTPLPAGRAVILHLNITTLKLAEIRLREQQQLLEIQKAELRQSEEQHRRFLEVLPDPMFVSIDDRVWHGNLAFVQLFGAHDAGRLVGRPLYDLFHREFHPVIREWLAHMRETLQPIVPHEERIVRLDGQTVPVNVLATPFAFRGETAIQVVLHDLTEQHSAQEALRASEERFRRAVEEAPFPILLYADDGEILGVNRAWVEASGYTLEELRTVSDWITRAHAEASRAVAERIARLYEFDQEVSDGEYLVRVKDGTKRFWDIRTATLGRTHDGRRLMVCTACDVTGRKLADERFRLLVEGVKDHALFLLDPAGTVSVWNSGATQMYGYQVEEILGQLHSRFFTPEDVAAGVPAQELRDALASGKSVMQGWRVRKDGSRFWSYSVVTALRDETGLLQGFAKLVQDLTEQQRAETERAMYLTAVSASADGIVITDPEGAIQWVNPAFCRMTGYKPDEVVGQTPRLLKSGEHDEAFYLKLWQTISSGQVWRGELRNRRSDGTLYTEEMTITPVKDPHGQIVNYIAIKQDVTDRRALEEQLRQAQKMEAIGLLAGGVAHDFNNLLTIISGYSEILLSLLPPQEPMRESVRAINEAGERAASLTRQLLAFSRKTVLQPRVLDLNDVILETEKMLRRLIGEDILFTIVLGSSVDPVKVDPAHLTQVLMNLAVNARDAMPEGGKLTIETANVELDRHYATSHADVKPGKYVLLALTDTGCGMTPEVKSRIFEPFFTTKEPGRGTGLGLATVFGIVRQSGGTIFVYSEPNIGTTFKIYFPAIGEAAVHSEEALPTGKLGGTETLLVVEDEEGVRGLAVFSLQSQGYRVLQANNGQDALRVVAEHPERIDLLVTDVVMPQMNGPALVSALRSQFPWLKVLYMSGYTDDAVVRRGILAAEVAFLQKPYTPLALARKVRQLLDEA